MPDVVDDDEGRGVVELLCQSGGGRCRTASEGGILGQESPVDLAKALDDVRFLGVATEFDPDDAISKGLVDRLVVAERPSQGAFTEAAAPLDRRGDCDRVLPLLVEQ